MKACDVDVDGFGWGPVLRLCIEMDLQKPLARGHIINVRGTRLWVPLNYEKLSKLCFKCGRITHRQGHCVGEAGNQSVAVEQYNPWLRVEAGHKMGRNKPILTSVP